eukprot:4577769-Pyramimonas_sp.AAC.1
MVNFPNYSNTNLLRCLFPGYAAAVRGIGWLALRTLLSSPPMASSFSVQKTPSGGWITLGRLQEDHPCIFGRPAPYRLAHAWCCPQFERLLAQCVQHPLPECPIQRFGTVNPSGDSIF